MALTFSRMFPLGAKAPFFNLKDTISGKYISSHDLQSDTATVILFICNHCPYVKHISQKIGEVASEFISKGVVFCAINSNDTDAFPEDSPDKMVHFAAENGFTFPYLFDETQEVAKAFMAVCTPDFFVFNSEMRCVYRGRFDESNHKNGIVPTGENLVGALNAILKGSKPSEIQYPSAGCNIKWKEGISPF